MTAHTTPRDVTRLCWLDGTRTESLIQTIVDTEVWVPRGDGSGYLDRIRHRTVREVYDLILAIVSEPVPGYPEITTIAGAEEYFSPTLFVPDDMEWPEGRTIIYAVTGTSEGNYVHVDVIGRDGATKPLLLGKTFHGRDAAWSFSRRLADLLQV